jgi:CHAD domain-containing protein
MPGTLQRHAAGTREARRIVGQDIAKARAALKSRRLSDSSIHRARKSIKKARAVWRLLREALPSATYRQMNMQLRDAGRPLGAARDAKILIVALDSLKMGCGPAAAHHLQRFRRLLIQNGNAIKRDVLMSATGVKLARRALTTAYQQVKRVPGEGLEASLPTRQALAAQGAVRSARRVFARVAQASEVLVPSIDGSEAAVERTHRQVGG